MVVRRSFGDVARNGTAPMYLLSWRGPYCVAWAAQRSYRVIEPTAWLDEDAAQPGASPQTFHAILRRLAKK